MVQDVNLKIFIRLTKSRIVNSPTLSLSASYFTLSPISTAWIVNNTFFFREKMTRFRLLLTA